MYKGYAKLHVQVTASTVEHAISVVEALGYSRCVDTRGNKPTHIVTWEDGDYGVFGLSNCGKEIDIDKFIDIHKHLRCTDSVDGMSTLEVVPKGCKPIPIKPPFVKPKAKNDIVDWVLVKWSAFLFFLGFLGTALYNHFR